MLQVGISRKKIRPPRLYLVFDPSVKTVPLWDIVKLFLGSTLTTAIAFLLITMIHGSRFVGVITVLSVGDLWYLARYEWLSSRRGWADLRRRFAPIDYRVLLRCGASGAALVLAFTGFEKVLERFGIKLADIPSPPFETSHFSQLPAAFILIVIIGPMAEELLFRGLLLDWLRARMRTWSAVITVGIIFSLAHGIAIKSGLSGWLQCGYRVLMGILAAAMTVRYQSLRASFAFHSTINLIGVVGMAFDSHG